MGVVVFDSDVLIGFMNPADAHHQDAIAWMREATKPQGERWVSAVNYSELLVGPLKSGDQKQVEAMLTALSIGVAAVDEALAERAASVRAHTGLKLADAYALALALGLEDSGRTDVRLASFDKQVLKAHADLRPG